MTRSKLDLAVTLLEQGQIDRARVVLFEAELELEASPEEHSQYIGEFRVLNQKYLKASSARLRELRIEQELKAKRNAK